MPNHAEVDDCLNTPRPSYDVGDYFGKLGPNATPAQRIAFVAFASMLLSSHAFLIYSALETSSWHLRLEFAPAALFTQALGILLLRTAIWPPLAPIADKRPQP